MSRNFYLQTEEITNCLKIIKDNLKTAFKEQEINNTLSSDVLAISVSIGKIENLLEKLKNE